MKVKTLENLKDFLEERNEIAFSFGVIEERRNIPEYYYLQTRRAKIDDWIEIYVPRHAEAGTEGKFNLYEIHKEEALKAHILMDAEEIEHFLRDKKGIKPKTVQSRLL